MQNNLHLVMLRGLFAFRLGCIPLKPATHSGRSRLPNPEQSGHAFLVSEKFSLFTLRGRLTCHRYDIFAKHDAIPLT